MFLLAGYFLLVACHRSKHVDDIAPQLAEQLADTSSNAPLGMAMDQSLYGLLFNQLLVSEEALAPKSDPHLPGIEASPTRWGTLPVSNGREPILLTIGTSISAGFRDGGLFRQGQLTAFPSLVAHQMGLKEYNVGAFPPSMSNGTGYLVLANTAGKPQYKKITNNLAQISDSPLRFQKVPAASTNLALPYLNYSGVYAQPNKAAERIQNNGSESMSMPFLMRLLPADEEIAEVSVLKLAGQLSYDISLLEFGFTDYLGFYQPQSIQTDYHFINNGVYPHKMLAERMGARAILLTVPEVRDLPYFQFFPANSVQGFCIDFYNGLIRTWASEYGASVFDLHGLYKQVMSNTYTTDDGYRIDPSFRTGNFFSSDGLHPSAIGHAVIANELIKHINSRYTAHIPLIHVGDYARQFEK
ncbi:hypothetical protein GCM10027275_47770 [Rhabdobacter roseus]